MYSQVSLVRVSWAWRERVMARRKMVGITFMVGNVEVWI
jgi:hypothetical protein